MHGQTSTSKLIATPLYHIKGKSVMKACWADMPCNSWGEHCISDYILYTASLAPGAPIHYTMLQRRTLNTKEP